MLALLAVYLSKRCAVPDYRHLAVQAKDEQHRRMRPHFFILHLLPSICHSEYKFVDVVESHKRIARLPISSETRHKYLNYQGAPFCCRPPPSRKSQAATVGINHTVTFSTEMPNLHIIRYWNYVEPNGHRSVRCGSCLFRIFHLSNCLIFI